MKRAEEIGLNTSFPDTKPLTQEQLAPLMRALKTAIRRNAEAFYQYAHSPDDLSPHMRALFNTYVPMTEEGLNEQWVNVLCSFEALSRDEFDHQLDIACNRMEKDPKFRVFANDIEGYTLTLPPAGMLTHHERDEDYFYDDILYLFRETRLADVSDIHAAHCPDGDGVLYTSRKIIGRECDHLEFETADRLCRFINECNPLMPHFSPKILQITRQ